MLKRPLLCDIAQVYCHATCATDTSNVSFVMDSVFDVVLKDNLRRMQKADLSKVRFQVDTHA